MANKFSFLHFLFFIYTISFQYLPGESHTTVYFDVSASLHRTLHVLSSDPSTTQEEPTITPQREGTTSSFSLSLHPRSSLHKPQYDDYTALTLSRIARDHARVNSLKTKLELSLEGVDRSTLRPVVNNDTTTVSSLVYGTNGLETPLTSGASQGSGEYFARLAVGQPPRQYYLVTDTGSDMSWLQCNPCSDCYQQSDPIFDPSGSSSYSTVSCGSGLCQQLRTSGCDSGSCLYQVSYEDGSFTIGTFATETLTFGNSGAVNNVAIGCGHDNEGLFIGAAGLLGLGGGPLSLTTQLKATSFSYCLVDRDSSSSSTLEFNTGRPAGAVTVPLVHNPRERTFFYVDFHGFVVGGRTVEIPTSVFAVDESTGRGGVIVDSGTAVTRLQDEAYGPLRDAFVGMTRDLPKTDSYQIFDTCYDLSGRQSAVVPTLGFLFAGGKTLQLPPENYLIPVNTNGKYCFAFATTNAPLSMIIGNVQQQGIRVTYDLANSVIGFSPKNC